jgi:hypothetical protein
MTLPASAAFLVPHPHLFARGRSGVARDARFPHEDAVWNGGRRADVEALASSQILAQPYEAVGPPDRGADLRYVALRAAPARDPPSLAVWRRWRKAHPIHRKTLEIVTGEAITTEPLVRHHRRRAIVGAAIRAHSRSGLHHGRPIRH